MLNNEKVGVIQTFLKFVKKNSSQCTSLELFVEKLYANIRDVHNAKIINLIEHYKNIA